MPKIVLLDNTKIQLVETVSHVDGEQQLVQPLTFSNLASQDFSKP